MKSALLIFAIPFFVMSATLRTAQFEEKLWKQKILLLQSTRTDVEKVFGKPLVRIMASLIN